MRTLNEKEKEIVRQKYELKKQYLEEYPIQINDKVDSTKKPVGLAIFVSLLYSKVFLG